VPAWRNAVLSTIVPAVRRAGGGLRAIAGRPLRLAQLLVGSVIVIAAYSSALVFSAWAVGVQEDFLAITITFLVATIVAAPAPTPGGLGVVEVALIAGLVLFGSPLALAIPAVFLYRLLTFWIPVGPGALAYRSLERSGRI
jgi:undecaprenyl-diphosphatase